MFKQEDYFRKSITVPFLSYMRLCLCQVISLLVISELKFHFLRLCLCQVISLLVISELKFHFLRLCLCQVISLSETLVQRSLQERSLDIGRALKSETLVQSSLEERSLDIGRALKSETSSSDL
jgi:hypothetical protein